ncbi:MAG: hypothetical protein K0U66_07100 [Gammaproteobacteria bacterium]|nr:hypothetical protein [Gammaproteobacteria bacterium]
MVIRLGNDKTENDNRNFGDLTGSIIDSPGSIITATDFGAVKAGTAVANAAVEVARALGIEGLRTATRQTDAGLQFAKDLTARNALTLRAEADGNRSLLDSVFSRSSQTNRAIVTEAQQGVERTAVQNQNFLTRILDVAGRQNSENVGKAYQGAARNTEFATGLVNDLIKSQQDESTQLADTLIRFGLPVLVIGFIAYRVLR